MAADDKKFDGAIDDELSDGKEEFRLCEEAFGHNTRDALDDIRFGRLGEQWPELMRIERMREGRPCLTINRMPSFIRQVVNDCRQARPSIKCHPVDDKADPQIAEIFDGLIRNIERTSKADGAYDWGVECAISGGFGYWRVDTDYAYDDSFDLDICINKIANQFSVFGDYASTASDSSDWNRAFVTELLTRDAFKKKYKGAEAVDWETLGYEKLTTPWMQEKMVLIAEWWTREQVKRPIVALSDGSIMDADTYKEQKDYLDAQQITVLGERTVHSHKVTQRIMTGAEVLETNDWAGKYIPIVPVYGEEVNIEGKRHFRSMIRDAKDPQRMLNYFRTNSTELVALAPRMPFIGKKGAFRTDAKKWATINSKNHQYVEYDGEVAPERQQVDTSSAVGSITEAANAADDMKAIIGIFDASLGAQGNEVSGKAILARQSEGDESNFHFKDNLSRAVEHTGRIIIDLIPKVYTAQRMIRVLDPSGAAQSIKLGSPIVVKGPDGKQQMQQDPMTGATLPITKICDLSVGRYDLTVETGPSYATKREEVSEHVLQMIQAYPPSAVVLGPVLAENLDWPQAREIAAGLRALQPPAVQQAMGTASAQAADPLQHPQVQQVVQQGLQQMQALQQQNASLSQELQAMKADKSIDLMNAQTNQFKAQTDRMEAITRASQPVIARQ